MAQPLKPQQKTIIYTHIKGHGVLVTLPENSGSVPQTPLAVHCCLWLRLQRMQRPPLLAASATTRIVPRQSYRQNTCTHKTNKNLFKGWRVVSRLGLVFPHLNKLWSGKVANPKPLSWVGQEGSRVLCWDSEHSTHSRTDGGLASFLWLRHTSSFVWGATCT